MTDHYEEWRDFYDKRVSSWMSLDELRRECGKLTTTDATSPELLLIHAMHALEEYVQRDDALRAEIEAAREDAERWRALREMDGGEIYALLGDCDGIHPEQADAAIDEAIEKENRND